MEQIIPNTRIVRALPDGSIEGYAAVWFNPEAPQHTEFNCYDNVFERLDRSSFDNVLSDQCVFTFEHYTQPVAINGVNLELTPDDTGLKYRVFNLPDTQFVRDNKELIARSLVRGSSFQADIDWDASHWEPQGNKETHLIKKVTRLLDVCTTAAPAYRGTSCLVRGNIPPEAIKVYEAKRIEWYAKRNQKRLEILRNKHR